MKTTTLALILFLTGLDLWAQNMPVFRQTTNRLNASPNKISPGGMSGAKPAPAPAPVPATAPVLPAIPPAMPAPAAAGPR